MNAAQYFVLKNSGNMNCVSNKKKSITLTPQQQQAFNKMLDFAVDEHSRVFILRGYAGTGKTTMMNLFIKELAARNIRFKLLASTGRAAKILNNITSYTTSTIHGLIYKFNDLNGNLEDIVKKRELTGIDSTGQLFLKFELVPAINEESICYIIDEASMVSDCEDKQITQAKFGSGRLLKDLLNYDPKGKFIFIGDPCQLPPVAQNMSPALSKEYFNEVYKMASHDYELTDVMRQSSDNDIVLSSKKVRSLCHNPQPFKWAKFPFKGYNNIHIVSSQAKLIQMYVSDVQQNGFNAASLICYSNAQSNTLTNIIRPHFGKHSHLIMPGDLLLITQNNLISGLLNGDIVTVEKCLTRESRAGLTFLKVSVKELVSGKKYEQFMIEEILYNNMTNLTQEQQRELFIDFYIRMKKLGIKQGTEEFESSMQTDSYLNALRTVYGYALTCHKAQGGEWDRVYLDIPRNLPSIAKPYVYQWVYTAMTRASKDLYVVDDFWIM